MYKHLILAALVLAVGIGAQDTPKSAHRFEKLRLTVDTAALGKLERRINSTPWCPAEWWGKRGKHSLYLKLEAYDRAEFDDIREPEDMLGTMVYNLLKEEDRKSRWLFSDYKHVGGDPERGGVFGYVPYALVGSSPFQKKGQDGTCFLLCGVLKGHGYSLSVDCVPQPDTGLRAAILKVLQEGVRYDGPPRPVVWSDAELKRYWNKYVSADLQDKLKIKRTDHYVTMFVSGGGAFARKMEDSYKQILTAFPFEEIPGRRRMPVFVFKTPEQYYHFYCKSCNATMTEAQESKGHAWRDYYATWFESSRDPTHLHEATHQVFQNRLFLTGGGSWFQEGVADFMSEKHGRLKSAAKMMIKKKDYVPFKRFMIIPSLISARAGGNNRGEDAGLSAYTQAATMILYLNKSPFGRKRFQDFVHAMGRVEDRDLGGMEQVFQEIYGIGIGEFEERWQAWFK